MSRLLLAVLLAFAVSIATGCGGSTPAPLEHASLPATTASGLTPEPQPTETPASANEPIESTASNDGGEKTDANPMADSTPQKEPNGADEKKKTPESESDPNDNTNEKAAPEKNGTGENGAQESGAEDGNANKDGKQSAAPKPDFKTERVVLFTLQGPLLVDIVLSIDNAPHDQALHKLVDYVLDAADTNNDGLPTWEELTESPKFMYGQLGNAQLTSAEMKRNAIQLYDVVKNGRVDASEVPRFLTRNAGGSRSFDFRSANYYRDINRSDSPLMRLLDSNEDGRIDYDEADRAEVQLLARDADSDGVLFSDEIANASEERPGPLTQRRVSAAGSSSWLGGKPKWTNVLYAMEEQYMLGGALEKSAFALTPDLFDRLNTNGDERIDSKEVAAMATVEPHLRIEAHFGKRENERAGGLKLSFIHADLKELADFQVSEGRIAINLPKDRMLIFLKDDVQGRQTEQRAAALLNQYDADNNNYLDEDEFPDAVPGLMGGLEAYDSDGDEKVYLKEIEEYLANAGVAQRSQIRSRAGDQTDALFDALDSNRDGRLDGREINSISAQLRTLDKDQNGEIIVEEIPGSMALAIVRGDPQQADTLFAIPISSPTPAKNAPLWFTRMDRNQDGAIAPGEFLGEKKQFISLDANADGFVSSDEVEPKKPQESAKSDSDNAPASQPKSADSETKELPAEANESNKDAASEAGSGSEKESKDAPKKDTRDANEEQGANKDSDGQDEAN